MEQYENNTRSVENDENYTNVHVKTMRETEREDDERRC